MKAIWVSIHRDPHTPMFTAALLLVAKICNQIQTPLTDDWNKKMWYLNPMGFYSARKKNEVMSCVSSFSVTMVKYHDQKQLVEETIHFCLQIQRESLYWQGRHGQAWPEQKPDWPHFIIQEAELPNWKWGETLNPQSPPLVMYLLQQDGPS